MSASNSPFARVPHVVIARKCVDLHATQKRHVSDRLLIDGTVDQVGVAGGGVADGGVHTSERCAHGGLTTGPARCACARAEPDDAELALLDDVGASVPTLWDPCTTWELVDDPGLDAWREYAREVSPAVVDHDFDRQECAGCDAHLDAATRRRGDFCSSCANAQRGE